MKGSAKAMMMVVAVMAFLLPAPRSAWAQWEVEADPIAFALSGYSAHLGYRIGDFRLDVGVFGLETPEAWHGNDGWSTRTNGVGVKLDFVGSGRGFFAGVEADAGRTRYTLDERSQSVSRTGFAAGARVGYRFLFGDSKFYIAPWVGVARNFGDLGVTIADRTFDEDRVRIFPTVHVGWRF